MAEHLFELEAKWEGGRLGEGTISAGSLQQKISIPKEMGGPGAGTNPEEMLLGAAGTCYLITLAAILQNRGLPVIKLSLATKGVVHDEGGLHFAKIVHRPQIVLASDADSAQLETARQAAERAEKACMISKALRGNVEISVEPAVETLLI